MQPRRDRYDVVVIGAGIGGLTAAALLAKQGMDVLVLDRRPVPGGVCHSFEKDGFTFDVGPHLLSNCGPTGIVHRTLRELGVDNLVQFLRIDPLARVMFPGVEITLLPSYEAFVDELARYFPAWRKQLLMLFREMNEVYEEVDSLPSDFGLWDFLKVPVTHPIFMKYPKRTCAEMMEDFLAEPKLRSIVSALWVYFGLPPSRLSAVFWSVVMMAYFREGGFYPRGGLRSLAAAMLAALNKHGGEFLGNAEVTRILLQGDEAVGVEFGDVSQRWGPRGELLHPQAPVQETFRVSAGAVICNADARRTLLDGVGEAHLPRKYVRRLLTYEPSLSVVKVGIAAKIDLEGSPFVAHDTVLHQDYDSDVVYERMRTGLPHGPCDVSIPTLTDSSLAPEGYHCIYLWNYAPYDSSSDWKSEGARLADAFVAWAEEHGLPGLSSAIVSREVMTPQTLSEYSLSTQGAPYGWAFAPSQMGFKRLQPRTPIRNLYLAGHWTTPGAGIAGVVMSGRNTASIIAQQRHGIAIWRKSA